MRSQLSSSPLRHSAGYGPDRIEHSPALPVRRLVHHRLGDGGRPGEGGSKRSPAKGPALSLSKGFTIVEVMMAAVILVVGFMGMIQAVTIGSEMLATARRQTLASQIFVHEMERLRLTTWTSMPTTGTDVAVGIGHQLWPSWTSTRNYAVNEVISYNGNGYRCNTAASNGELPTNTSFWTATSTAQSTDIFIREGVTFSLTQTVTDFDPDADGTTDSKEISLTLVWTKGGTTTAAIATDGTWLEKLAFYRESPIARTYIRRSVSWFTKYGLNHAIQRS